jgi:hypothetical protein
MSVESVWQALLLSLLVIAGAVLTVWNASKSHNSDKPQFIRAGRPITHLVRALSVLPLAVAWLGYVLLRENSGRVRYRWADAPRALRAFLVAPGSFMLFMSVLLWIADVLKIVPSSFRPRWQHENPDTSKPIKPNIVIIAVVAGMIFVGAAYFAIASTNARCDTNLFCVGSHGVTGSRVIGAFALVSVVLNEK